MPTGGPCDRDWGLGSRYLDAVKPRGGGGLVDRFSVFQLNFDGTRASAVRLFGRFGPRALRLNLPLLYVVGVAAVFFVLVFGEG